MLPSPIFSAIWCGVDEYAVTKRLNAFMNEKWLGEVPNAREDQVEGRILADNRLKMDINYWGGYGAMVTIGILVRDDIKGVVSTMVGSEGDGSFVGGGGWW